MGKCLVLLQFDVLLTFIGDLFFPKQKRKRSELEIGTERVVGKYWKAKLWLGYKINKFILKKECSHNSLEPWFLYFIAVPRTFVLSYHNSVIRMIQGEIVQGHRWTQYKASISHKTLVLIFMQKPWQGVTHRNWETVITFIYPNVKYIFQSKEAETWGG